MPKPAMMDRPATGRNLDGNQVRFFNTGGQRCSTEIGLVIVRVVERRDRRGLAPKVRATGEFHGTALVRDVV